ncbi:23S rRNA (adenine(2030)-N(6))-methyltransferase RlmJ [Stagnihabitans tardus]|uniref:Ribosomal RNA large subunit methyltransferase J n=1 Tax=Stagnihabitans tardus TaxID=2699202 RepID=A0AAE4YDG9_9RHOB|nr:23S rRNA (adenine(2030)-N(6))-methyltransferase RlmJ [Stagnihabitans tardus]NBZ89441.1 23S rRNA (adenine(2030)-N(6))-methyltransferase RlmJ [Stagnihabitans tardus]
MLSYQHAYHAGNAADVQKHALLAWMLDYLTQKDKAFTYLETHAGRGLYDLAGPEATKTGEAAQGISRLEARLPEGHPYRRVLSMTRKAFGRAAYPGSPLIAGQIMRPQDGLWLCELHPQEHQALEAAIQPLRTANHASFRILKEDGLAAALSLTPPNPRRGMMLIDPSFEVKTDYDRLPVILPQVARRWNVGILALWYPILTDAPHGPMIRSLQKSFPEALTHEVRFPPARPGHRMVGSGLFVVNPPYGLHEEAKRLSALFR